MEDEAAIFEQARSLAGLERETYLGRVCRGDSALKQRIASMLASAARADAFFGETDVAPVECDRTDTVLPAELSEGPGTRIGRYKLLQKIGEGGMGVVYMAEQTAPVIRKVALKIIKLGMDTRQVVARFEAERQALAMMDHPNIAQVLDGGTTESGRLYFVMELVQGVSITEFCDKNKLTARERLRLLIPVCQAIQRAHQKGIIHRDIKPSNVLVTLHHGEPMPKVIDFGIAKATNQKLTEKTLFTNYATMIGTPAYMSPEQAQMSSLDVDTRTDIYSLGVLLYELLTGTTPFPEKRLRSAAYGEIQRIILEEDPEKPSTRLSTMSAEEKTAVARTRGIDLSALGKLLKGDLDWVVMKCLEKDRRRRYETANAVATDIQRYLNDETVVARPPSTAYRLQKAFRRNRLAFLAAGATSLVLALGTVASTWQAVRARRAERDANAARQSAVQNAARAQAESQRAVAAEQAANEHLLTVRSNLYAANINLVQAAWEQNNVWRARQLLRETADYPDRGFEWFYWQRQMHLETKTLTGHTKAVCGVGFSPDGRRIITGSWDQTAKVWEAATGRELVTLRGDNTHVNAVAFSPDGRRIATGSGDTWTDSTNRESTARIWDAATGGVRLTLRGHTNAIYAVAFSADGQRLVTGSVDRTARVWDLNSGRTLATLKGHTGAIRSVAFSPDGQRIVTGCGDRWDPGPDSTARVWDAQSGTLLFKLQGHNASIHAVAFSPDGQRILTASWDGTAKVWEAADGQELLTLKSESSAPFLAAVFSADGERILTGSVDQTATLWDANKGQRLRTFKGHSDPIISVAFSPDGQRIVTGSGDWVDCDRYTAKIWDALNDREVLTLRGHKDPLQSAAFSPDAQRILTTSKDTTAKIWNAATGKEILTLQGHEQQVNCAMFSPDGKQIVTGSSDRTAKLWEAATGKELLTLTGHSDFILAAAFFRNGQRIVTGSHDGTARVWNVANGKELFSIEAHSGKLWCVAVSPDSETIATVGDYRKGKLWDAATGKELLTLNGHTEIVVAVAFSPDGRKIVTGSSDRTTKVWDTATGKELVTLTGHAAQVWSVAFSPDGQRIVTAGSYDRTAKVWDSVTGKSLLTLKGHTAETRYAGFSPDGQCILTGGWDGTAKVWEAATAEQVRAWQAEQSTGPPLGSP